MSLIIVGYCQKFNHETRSTDEIMRELRKDNLFPDETVDSLYDKIKAYSAAKGERRSATAQEAAQ